MAFTLLKVYKNGGFLVTSNVNCFSPPDVKTSSHFGDMIQYREAIVRAKRLLDKMSITQEDAMYTYVRACERNKKINFNHFLGEVKEKKQSFDYSNSSAESVRKAKRRVVDICLCNNFNWFVTLTLNADIVQRYNPVEVVAYFGKWAKNYFRRNSGYYVFVPEKHKDGAFHFHGLILSNNRDGMIQRAISPDTGEFLKNSRGEEIYNLVSWKGHTTCIPLSIDNLQGKIKYIIKYITKDSRCLPRFYYSGGQLVRKPALVYINDDENAFDRLLDCGGFAFSPNINNSNIKFAGLWLDDVQLSNLDDF